jgi:hypothetical protein
VDAVHSTSAFNFTLSRYNEGHKIRNPDAEVTICVKQLQTVGWCEL